MHDADEEDWAEVALIDGAHCTMTRDHLVFSTTHPSTGVTLQGCSASSLKAGSHALCCVHIGKESASDDGTRAWRFRIHEAMPISSVRCVRMSSVEARTTVPTQKAYVTIFQPERYSLFVAPAETRAWAIAVGSCDAMLGDGGYASCVGDGFAWPSCPWHRVHAWRPIGSAIAVCRRHPVLQRAALFARIVTPGVGQIWTLAGFARIEQYRAQFWPSWAYFATWLARPAAGDTCRPRWTLFQLSRYVSMHVFDLAQGVSLCCVQHGWVVRFLVCLFLCVLCALTQ